MRATFLLIPVFVVAACGGAKKTPPPAPARRVVHPPPAMKPPAPPAPVPVPKKEEPVPGADAGLLAPIVCPAGSAPHKTPDEEGCLAEDGEGRVTRTGRWRSAHPGGAPHTHREYKLGVREGAWRIWDEKGSLRIAFNYVNGKLQGEAATYARNGETVYRPVQASFEAGEPVSVTIHRADGKAAVAVEYYDDSTVLTVTSPTGGERVIAELRRAKINLDGSLENLLRWLEPAVLARWARGYHLFPAWLAELAGTDREVGEALKARLLAVDGQVDLGGLPPEHLARIYPNRLVKDLVDYLPNEILAPVRKAFPEEP